MESLVFVALSPIALLMMGVVGVVSWRRRGVPGGRALAAFSLSGAGWLACDALSVAAQTPEATLWLARAAVAWSPLPGVAWLAFLLSYTERFTRPAQIATAALTAWSLVYGAMALTNEMHHLVWATSGTVADGPFLGAVSTLGPLAWAQSAFMWSAVGGSLVYVLWAYAGAVARERVLSRWIVAGALVPFVLSLGHHLGFGPVEKDLAPLAMAISSGTFALGIARYQLLDLRPIARAALVDNLTEGMLVLDVQGRVVDANPALRQALGASAAVTGRPLAETAPALAHALDAAPSDTLRLGTETGVRYYDLRISPLSDRGGNASGRLVLLHDVTVRRRERAALRHANADLYDANAELQARNDELDAFAHTVAHDLKNSIQCVMGCAEILRDDGPVLDPETHREIADDAVRSARKMGTVVHELLLLAGVRQATVEPRPIKMGEVVAEALLRSHVAVAAVPDAWPVARGHAPWVEEVWVNYLSNAAKYGGPTVTLGAETTAAGQARFWVHDDGPPIPAEAQARLFLPFSRVTEAAVEGHGLGLSIVRRITERLGGTCGVESAPGVGTRFWFALPSAPEVADTATFAARAAA